MRAPAIISLLLLALALSGCTTRSTGRAVPAIPVPAPAPTETKATGEQPQGGTYKGKVARGYDITFKLSPDGKQITELSANVLESCTGSSTSRTTTLYFDGPFVAGADGTFAVAGEEKEYGTQYRFAATFTKDGKASGIIYQAGAGCTTYELKWEAEQQ